MNAAVAWAVNYAAIGSLTPFRKRFPELMTIMARGNAGSLDWDFFMTAAGCGIAVLQTTVASERVEILSQASEINERIPAAVQNFLEFLDKYSDLEGPFHHRVGTWVVWNIAGELPPLEEFQRLAPAIGAYLQGVVKHFAEPQNNKLPLLSTITNRLRRLFRSRRA